ncbi:MAG: hypothetical protein JNJ54_05145 [Myxococcaceae bacterium]|nr:hypothetical protein [Myxococcaceae bacterium]
MSEPKVGQFSSPTLYQPVTGEPAASSPAAPLCKTPSTETTSASTLSAYQPASSHGLGIGPAAAGGDEVGPACSPAELQRLADAEKANGKALQKGFSTILEPLGQFIDCQDQRTRPALAAAMAKSDEFQKMLKTVPRELVELAVEDLISQRLPNATPEEKQNVQRAFAREVNHNVRTNTAQQLRESVTHQLEVATERFERAAGDPKQLDLMLATLARFEAPPASAENRAAASALREALGVASDGQVTRESLSQSLKERAALMRQEAHIVGGGGETTLYRTLKLHSGMAKAMQAEQGVKPGSWSASGPALVESRAEADANLVAGSKLVSSIAMGVTGGFLAVAAFNAPHLNAKWAEVDRARAGLSAGTADRSAVTAAERELVVAAGEAVFATFMARESSLLAHHSHDALKMLGHPAAEGLAGGLALQVEHAIKPAAQGVDGDGVSRAMRRP